MTALAFDLGDTLVEYEGLPSSWEAHYPHALARLAAYVKVLPAPEALDAAQSILRRYNTRLKPRQVEVPFSWILTQLLESLGVAASPDELRCAEAFFSVFRQRLRSFPDAIPLLHRARARGQKIGIFTDVPYGMPRELVMEDVAVSGLSGLIDVLITSREAGYRKPSPQALQALPIALGCARAEMAYVGNERKDVQAALAFGCEAVLLARDGSRPCWGQHRTISSLCEL